MEKKSQSSIEFMILAGAMLFFFISMLFVFQQNLALKAKEKRTLEVKEVALTVQKEIEFAAGASNGYQREFKIPQTIINSEYEIKIINNAVYINTTDGKHAMALPIQIVAGEIKKGANIIRKQNETVYLNC